MTRVMAISSLTICSDITMCMSDVFKEIVLWTVLKDKGAKTWQQHARVEVRRHKVSIKQARNPVVCYL